MKHKLIAILCSLGVILGCISAFFHTDVHAKAKPTSESNIILHYKMAEANCTNIQTFIDSMVSDNAGRGSEWYVFALANSFQKFDFSKYYSALEEYLSANEIKSATERERIALALVAIGKRDHAFVKSTVDDAIGAQGIMSYIFGLHLLNNGVVSEKYSAKEVIADILSMQKEDGGWAVTGQYSDVDVTAMALQALAKYNGVTEYDDVSKAISRALAFLSEKQTENGGFMSYGKENAESSAQVLIALDSLKIDINEAAFVKNRNSIFYALIAYVTESGAVEHEKGLGANEIATMQTFCAFSAYENEHSLFDFSSVYDQTGTTPEPLATVTPTATKAPENTKTPTATVTVTPLPNTEKQSAGYKLSASIIVIGIVIALCLLQLLRKKRSFKNYLFIVILGLLALCFIWLTSFESKNSFFNQDSNKKNIIGTVTMSISCDTIIGKADYIPINGMILEKTEFEIEEGSSVYDILLEAAGKYQLQLVHKGTSTTAYISSINSIAELDFGDLSGWMYQVNGRSPSVGCGIYKLEAGDVVEWKYTCNLGEDLK